MFHQFTFNDKRGDVVIAGYEGLARIVPGDNPGSWRIAGIALHGFHVKSAKTHTIDLSTSDPLYAPIAVHVHQTQTRAINDAWRRYLLQEKAHAS